MEIGLQYANKEIKNNHGIPISMVIIIGDSSPNTLKEVEYQRKTAAENIANDEKYWENTDNYRSSTCWEYEIRKIKE
jgi:hypothetical protein